MARSRSISHCLTASLVKYQFTPHPAVEHPELVAERLVRLARLVGRENVMAGTDCGFAQSPHVRRVHPSIMWAKLQALAAGARLATKELWGRM